MCSLTLSSLSPSLNMQTVPVSSQAAGARHRDTALNKISNNNVYSPQQTTSIGLNNIKTNNHNRVIPSLEYGNLHEQDAVDCYVAVQHASGNTNLKVFEVGTKISKKNPGCGASLDRLVYDPLSTSEHTGGLEVKCPYSKRGMSIEEACSDAKFYLSIFKGEPVLKRGHEYYYQVQGQMYVCQLNWVDFVVWFGSDVIAVE